MTLKSTIIKVIALMVSCASLVCVLPVTAQAADLRGGSNKKNITEKRIKSARIQDITYASLLTLKNNSKLSIGQRYRISNFQTIHVVTWDKSGPVLHTGPIEPLIVTAETNSILSKIAISEMYPDDVIHYALVKYRNNGNGGGGDKGIITYRWEPERNIEAHFDWRNSKVRLWEESPGSGKWIPDPETPDKRAFRDFSFWEPQGINDRIEDIHIASTNSASVARVVFMGSATKVRIEDATDPVIFMKKVYDFHLSTCGSLVAYDDVENVVILGGNVIAKKSLFQVLFGPEAGGEYEGSLSNCQVFTGWNNDGNPVLGDRIGELIGYPKIK